MSDEMNESKATSTEMDNDTAPPLYGFIDKHELKNNQANTITIKMIMDRNLKKALPIESVGTAKKQSLGHQQLGTLTEVGDEDGQMSDAEEKRQNYADVAELKANQLLGLTRVHLDRENIGEIDNLDTYLGDVTHLYLQHNLIKRIENLEFLHKLKFICLANNQITQIENLNMLNQLVLLDLSYNQIEDLPKMTELPFNLAALDLRNNPCVSGDRWPAIVNDLKSNLKRLNQLNGSYLNGVSDQFAKMELSSEEQQDCEDSEKENGQDSFEMMREKVVQRSKLRQESDIAYMEKISKERKIRLDEARQSISENFK